MSTKLIVGLDGSGSGDRALAYAKRLSKLIGKCSLELIYVIEWSPYSFQTPEENASRHKRREEEIKTAMERVIQPALDALKADGFTATGRVKHGDAADILNAVAMEEKAEQIVVARSSEGGFTRRIFGSVTANLVMHASVPVTVVG
ncbi:universal stress protein [Kiloniella laminariae]|uniref:universal stress protein n=1 Tax=Kiloniella laminariae TaxID=454162 RepID=UPI0003781098|nr:universal stress protein [Kiloniella laminariae]